MNSMIRSLKKYKQSSENAFYRLSDSKIKPPCHLKIK